MQKNREILESLDEITLKMLNAVQSQNFDKLNQLYETRNELFGKFKKLIQSGTSLPEAELSKLSRDTERLSVAMRNLSEKVKLKIEEISKNIELIQGYAVSKNDFHINERR